MRQLSEQCQSCKKQISTLETCVLPDCTEKRGVEITLGESVERGIRCRVCAEDQRRADPAPRLKADSASKEGAWQ